MIVVAFPEPNEHAALTHYTNKVGKLLAEAGGKPVSKYKANERLHGEHTPSNIFIGNKCVYLYLTYEY